MVYVFLANGFEEIEAIAPIDLLRRAGAELRTVGVGGMQPEGAHGVRVACDIDIAQAELEGVDMLVLPGGSGHKLLGGSARLCDMLNDAATRGLYIGAICAAPAILGDLGLLNGKTATCFPGYEQRLTGATLADKHQRVVRDGNVITARGAGVSVEFGLKLIEALCGVNTSNAVRDAIQCG